MREKVGVENESFSVLEMRSFRAEKVLSPPLGPEARSFIADTLTHGCLDLEIGCGVGWHPIRYALENPDRRLIAIERTSEKFEKFETRISAHQRKTIIEKETHSQQRGMPSLLPVHADAVAWTACHLPDACLSRVFILYPNPSLKNAAGRWIRMPFFGNLLSKLKPDGVITLRTNIEAYADEVVDHAKRVWKLQVSLRRFTRDDIALGSEWTHFERKYLDRGETCFEIQMKFS